MTRNKSKIKRCSKCGFRVRGKNHDEGFHHKNGSGRSTGKMRKY
tara:strand:- start:62 stop:193 length:132 start_codon:yes stop_codon:yes gene_type:complete